MKSRFWHRLLILPLTVSLPAFACINETSTNYLGERIELMSYGGHKLKPHLVTPATKGPLITSAEQVIALARKNPSFQSLNDLAAVLIRFGRLPEAVNLLQFLERKYPGHYETAANVGTAYELMGRNKDALKWILEGIKRNPDDHFGTEWLHAHILRAKLGTLTQSAPGRSILNIDFGDDPMPRRPSGLPLDTTGKPQSLFSVAHALRYQLLERIQFVDAPDRIVAGLLLDWANLELITGSIESADVLYDAAVRYGSQEGRQIAIRKKQVEKILAQSKVRAVSPPGR